MKTKIGVILLSVLILLAAAAAGVIKHLDNQTKTTFTAVKGTVHEYAKPKLKLEPLEDLGTNLALHLEAEASSYTQDKLVEKCNDGDATTYWEGAPDSYPNALTVDLKSVQSIKAVRIKLNPDGIWEKRSQTLSIQGSLDNKKFEKIQDAQDYVFDPESNANIVTIKFDPVKTQYVRLNFTANSGATAGQAAEVEIY